MGSGAEEKDRLRQEGPQTRVTIRSGVWLSEREVTQEQYQAVMGCNPSYFKGDPNRPVENVRWYDAARFCAQLTAVARQTDQARFFQLRERRQSLRGFGAVIGRWEDELRTPSASTTPQPQLWLIAWKLGSFCQAAIRCSIATAPLRMPSPLAHHLLVVLAGHVFRCLTRVPAFNGGTERDENLAQAEFNLRSTRVSVVPDFLRFLKPNMGGCCGAGAPLPRGSLAVDRHGVPGAAADQFPPSGNGSRSPDHRRILAWLDKLRAEHMVNGGEHAFSGHFAPYHREAFNVGAV